MHYVFLFIIKERKTTQFSKKFS